MELSLKKYRDYVAENSMVTYEVSFEPLPFTLPLHKWVGAQSVGNCLYGIPNDMTAILEHTAEGNRYLGDVGKGMFKWTGGCIWNGCLYGFPRASSKLLKMFLESERIEYVSLEKEYLEEHHYGGVCTKDGIVYQPPRDSDHILVWDLKTETVRRIYLNAGRENKKLRYCGSILNSRGDVYFLPELGEKVIKLDTRTGEWSEIGDRIDAMVFDAKTGVDGNIYGYSAYCEGILKINTVTNRTEMIHKEISPRAYGTKLGVNGHLYSIPGDGDEVWDYDPMTDSLKSIYHFSCSQKAKFAGGVSLKNGMIYGVPATENRLFRLEPSAAGLAIPEDVFQDYFLDCY